MTASRILFYASTRIRDESVASPAREPLRLRRYDVNLVEMTRVLDSKTYAIGARASDARHKYHIRAENSPSLSQPPRAYQVLSIKLCSIRHKKIFDRP